MNFQKAFVSGILAAVVVAREWRYSERCGDEEGRAVFGYV